MTPRTQRSMVTFIVVVVSVVLVSVGSVGLMGSTLDRVQRVEAEIRLPAPVVDVWTRVAEDRAQAWRSDLDHVEVVDEQRWIEHPHSGPPVRFEVLRAEAPHRFTLAFEGSGFRGRWDGVLTDEGGGTVLRISEEVETENPFARVLARAFFGPDRAVAQYRADLERSFAMGRSPG